MRPGNLVVVRGKTLKKNSAIGLPTKHRGHTRAHGTKIVEALPGSHRPLMLMDGEALAAFDPAHTTDMRYGTPHLRAHLRRARPLHALAATRLPRSSSNSWCSPPRSGLPSRPCERPPLSDQRVIFDGSACAQGFEAFSKATTVDFAAGSRVVPRVFQLSRPAAGGDQSAFIRRQYGRREAPERGNQPMEVCSSSSSMWGTIPQCSGALATPNMAGAAGAKALMSALPLWIMWKA